MRPRGAGMDGVLTMEYLIEQLGHDGRWFILGSEPTNGRAQSEMRSYQRLFPHEAIRVRAMVDRFNGKRGGYALHEDVT